MPRQRGVVSCADGVDQTRAVDATEHRNGQLRTNSADGQQLFEEAFLVQISEAEQGQLVLSNVGEDVQAHLCTFGRKAAEGRHTDRDVVADARALDDGSVGRLRK